MNSQSASHRSGARGFDAQARRFLEGSIWRLPKRFRIALIAMALVACAGCNGLRHGRSGVALPPGDAQRGKAAFRELRCYACHSVSGHDFPHPSVQPPVLVVLGTEDHAPTRRELVNSIINPSHKIYPGIDRTLVQTNQVSRMSDFSEVLTVRQLSDLVAFLETLHR